MEKPMQNPTNGFGELGMGSSVESLQRFLDSQKELFHSQVDQLQKIVLTQCRLTGVNPLAQEMAAGALSIKIGKRPRDLLNPKAIKYMQSVFCIKDTISKKETREISALCGVTVTQVREFFAGQRSRVRRFVRLAREKAIRVDSCKASLDGCSINSDHALQVSDVVPLNSVDPKDVEGSSCLSQQESNLAIDSSDKNFVENIFNLMRKEETFSGQEKLMEWVLQIQNPAVLQLFLTKGGIEILATWLNQAAVEEQTTVLLVIFKVLCHLPLHKALPAQMSAILQTVNRLRFYRTSDISNRARVLLSRWSKLFVRSQALNKPFPRNSPSDLQKERIRKQRISEILSDESWQSKIDIPEDILSLAWEGSEISRSEPTKSLKLLTASPDDSSKKHVRSVASSQTRERRKVLLVEQPGSRTPGRCMQVSRAVSTNQGRPMSADDIQKAKMRAIFMQSKYGKIGSSSNKSSPEKKEGPQASYASQTRSTLVTSKTFHPNKEEDKKPFTPSETSQALPETPIDSKPNVTSQALPETPIDSKPNVTSHEPLWQKLEKDQIPWETPSEMRINCLWRIGAGERSKEVEVQTERICREKETIHRNANDIPPDPREPWDVEMDFDDSLTPEIPREQLPEVDGKDVPSPRNCDNSTQVSVAAPPPTGNGNPEPDFELLAVLLKNPELVFALTSGQGNSLTSSETVALLDKLRAIGIRLPSVLGGLDGNVAEKREVTSLPSPTPPHEQAMRWKSEPAQMLVPNKATPSLPVFPQFSNGEDVTFQGVSLTPSVTAEKPMPSGSSLHQFLITSSPVAHAPSLQQRPLISPLPDRPPNHSTSVAVSPSLQQLPLVSPLPSKPLPVNQTGPHLQSTPTSSLPPVHTPVAPPVLRQPSRTIPAPPHQIPVTISSSEQRPVPETMLAANRFQVTRSHNQNNLSTGSDIRQLPTIRVENSSFGRIPNLKNPSMTAFTNTTMDRPHTPSLMPSLIPNPTPMRSQPARLPEHQAFSAPPATWSLNVHPSGRYGSASNSNASSNSRPKGSLDDRSFDIRLPDNRNNCDAFRTGPMQPQFLHGPAVERNEFLAEPELEEWSPDRSPLRTSEFRSDRSPLRTSEFRPDRSPLRTSELRPDRKYNEPRKDYGRSYRPEWPRHRNSGHRERDRDRDHRSGNRRWRDRRY